MCGRLGVSNVLLICNIVNVQWAYWDGTSLEVKKHPFSHCGVFQEKRQREMQSLVDEIIAEGFPSLRREMDIISTCET
jgi:hypothetical protein